MTQAQFMCIIGTIYITHDMDPSYRKFAGVVCFVIAVVLEYLS